LTPDDHIRKPVNVVAGVLCLVVIAAAVLLILHHAPARRRHTSRAPALAALPFARTSVWNARLGANAPLSSDSRTYVDDLLGQVSHYGTWINTTSYSVPVYVVPRGEHRVPVRLDISGPGSVSELAATFHAGVPSPTGAIPARGSDASMVIWQPSRNTLWELWKSADSTGGWHARWGGKMSDVSSNPGYFTTPSDWGGSATSLSLLGGLITPRDLRAGAINHTLALSIPHAEAKQFVFPAQRTDGNDTSSTQIPEGTRFRLRPSLDISSLHLPLLTAMIARAAQRYGMIVRDQSGDVVLYAEDPSSIGHDPWNGVHGAFRGMSPAQLLRNFPWRDLEAVSPAVSRP
jgi:hypothetical protein